jgi:cytochrome c-type biogenesis protein
MDLYRESIAAISGRSVYAPPLVFAVGVASSIGPCVAPRFLALAACVTGSKNPTRTVLSFITGLVLAYILFGLTISLISNLQYLAPSIYGIVAASLLIAGIYTLVHARPAEVCEHTDHPVGSNLLTWWRTALFGASFAFVVSPCCTPIVIAILVWTAHTGSPVYGMSLLAVFALGHSTPLVAYGIAGGRFNALISRFRLDQAAAICSGTLMLALGAYYIVMV